MLKIKEIEYNSDEYIASVDLRDKILRKPIGLKFTEEFLAKDVRDFHIGAFISGKLVSILILSPVNTHEIKMRQVAVDNSLSGQGIGSKLVEYSEKFSRQKGFRTMLLHARESAMEFYKKLNYKVVGEKFFEVGIAHFKMEKAL
ncbi:MAG: GNAT family N-acetyltransferase [Bacteroidota bacterium]